LPLSGFFFRVRARMRRVNDVKAKARGLGLGLLAAVLACGAAADQVVFDEAGFNYVIEGFTLAELAGAGALNGVASGDANLHTAVVDNRVEEAPGDRAVLLQDSLSGNAGIFGVNQSAGEVNNQANLRVFAIAGAIQHLDLSGGLELRGNTLVSAGGARENMLRDSGAGSVGVVGVNQSAGSLNVQTNALLLAVGAALGSDVLTMGDASLGRVVADNVREGEAGGPRADTMAGAFQDFRGVVQVAQSAGDLNLVGNTLAISIVAVTLPVTAP
jgi:hypothetical protein